MRYVNLQLNRTNPKKSEVFQSDVGNYWVLTEGAQQVAVGLLFELPFGPSGVKFAQVAGPRQPRFFVVSHGSFGKD